MGHVPKDAHWDEEKLETKWQRIFKRVLKVFCVTALVVLVTVSVFLLWLSNHYIVPILMYHNVENISKSEPNWVSPERFNSHMAFLDDHDYKVITLDHFVESLKKRAPLSRKTVVITFDDGFENVYKNAFPILKKFNFQATIFIASDVINQPGFLTEEQLKEMMQYGIDTQSHSRTHRYLPDLPYEEQRDEIIESRRRLEKKLGVEIKYFAYPIGGFTDDIKSIVKSAGYKAAFTTNRGKSQAHDDLYELNRIRFSDSDNQDFSTWGKLSGYYNFFRKNKTPY